MSESWGDWITTYTGKKFHYLNPQPDEINIRDIAHALSLICRFGGHCREFYSVAEHSIRVMELVDDKSKLAALLHDSEEAYLADVSRPVKNSMGQAFNDARTTIRQVILEKFGASGADWHAIKKADDILLATEARDLMANTDEWAELPLPLPQKIEPITSRAAEILFLDRFEVYRQ
jgi:5'-deoxynucleotidase YfbR-like HD superfamily hydrolase